METTGLTEAEASRRLHARGEMRRPATSRSYASIVRANVVTVFNLILLAFGALTLAFGDWRDALFLGIVVVNAGIGITQEVRAKRALDRLALLVAPTATVIRDGQARTAAVEEVVIGDLLRVQAGDQVVADGIVRRSDGLSVDESILTGESHPVVKTEGDEVRSGAFAVEGSGVFEATAVGEGSYAERLAGEARSFRHPRSPLERAINRLLFALVAFVVVLGGVLGYSLWHRDAGLRDAVSTSTAGVVSLVPEGLVVLVALTYAVGSLRMARRGVLAQQLNAIESLAAADVVCMDKTGTLTESRLRVLRLVPATGVAEAEVASTLGAYAASTAAPNATLTAIAQAHPAQSETVRAQVPFSSRRRWSGLVLDGQALVVGAPELFDLGALDQDARAETAAGRRVVALARAPSLSDHVGPEDPPPAGARPLGLVVLAEELRPNIRETVAFLLEQDVELKVLSGDAPQTVAAIAADAGIPVKGAADGGVIPTDGAALRDFARDTTVVGRISPEGKRRMVEALRDDGRYVAMVGDGVNDVPALKSARLAIAQGTGAQMTKSVADLVLVSGDFAVVPAMIHEGRQALRNLQRVAKLYVTKSAFAAFLILTIGVTSTAYPLLPRHFTIAASLTIGIPTFFLALAPSSGPWRTPSFAREVARFAIPAGFIVGAGVVSSYLFALHDLDFGVRDARTIATTVLVIAGFYLVLELETAGWRRGAAVAALCGVLGLVYVGVLAIPGTRSFFDLTSPDVGMVLTAIGGSAVAIVALYLAGYAPLRQ